MKKRREKKLKAPTHLPIPNWNVIDVLWYEILSSWWVPLFPVSWQQGLLYPYFIWKAKRKWKRFDRNVKARYARIKRESHTHTHTLKTNNSK